MNRLRACRSWRRCPSPSSSRRSSAWRWSARSTSGSTTATISTRCCSPSASCSWRWRRSTTRWARSSSSSSCRRAARRVDLGFAQVGIYRSFIIAVCGVLVIVLQLILSKTRFGSRLRAAVDDDRGWRRLGINVNLIFGITSRSDRALPSRRSARCGDPRPRPDLPVEFMIYFLIVVTVGGPPASPSVPGVAYARHR